MKKILLLLVMLIGLNCSALAVNAETSAKSPSDENADVSEDLDERMKDIHESVEDVIWMTTVYDGKDAFEDVQSIEEFNNLKLLSAKLEAGHFYRVNFVFTTDIDVEHPDKYDDLRFQVRFPQALLANQVNSIGSAVFGSEITSRSFNFGITCEENLRLSYVADSGELLDIANYTGGAITDEGIILLLTSAEGLPIGTLFEDTRDLDGVKVVFFEISFLIYASPLKGAIVPEEVGLSYWNGRDLMADFEVTPAPMHEVYVVEMDENGEIIPPGKNSDVTDVGNNGNWIGDVLWSLAIVVVVMTIAFMWRLLWLKRHYKLDSLRAAGKKFVDDFVDVMKLGDDDDYDEDDDDETDILDEEVRDYFIEELLQHSDDEYLKFLRNEIEDKLYARGVDVEESQMEQEGSVEVEEE